jgi:hypothetical protein
MALAASCAGGCQHAASNYPSDPIFVTKQPIISKPELKPPEFVGYLEPDVPAGPVEAVARRTTSIADGLPATLTVRGQSAD